MRKKLFCIFLPMMWNWSCRKPKHRAGGTGAAGRRSQAPAEPHLWHCFEEKMLSLLFSPPFTEAKPADSQRRRVSLPPIDFIWNNNCVSLLGPGGHLLCQATKLTLGTWLHILSLVSLQLKISGHNSSVSSFLSYNSCKINLGINHLSLTITETLISPLWTFIPAPRC